VGKSSLRELYSALSKEEAAEDMKDWDDVEEGMVDPRLEGSWEWPFLVTSRIGGRPLKSLRGSLTPEARLDVASLLGRFAHSLFATPLPSEPLPIETPNLRLDYFRGFLEERMKASFDAHKGWETMPARLLDQMKDFLPSSVDELIQGEPCESELGLLHADLHGEHGRFSLLEGEEGEKGEKMKNMKVKMEGVIDFGDAIVGNRLYEMVQVLLSSFLGDKRMLVAFVREYLGPDFLERLSSPSEEREKNEKTNEPCSSRKEKFVYHCMCYTLIHECNALASSSYRFDFDKIDSLDTMAHMLWDITDLDLVAPLLPREEKN